MFYDLQGKTALITGASGGLGLAFAQILARQGVTVTLAARRLSALDEACDGIRAQGGRAEVVELDVTDAGSVNAAVAAVPGRLDILVNNAGISIPGNATDLGLEDWNRQIAINLTGVFITAQAAARRMIADGNGGAVVNIASILGFRVAGAVSAYAAAKAGVVQLTASTALEWARHGIRVNALCPGYIETDINREFFASEAGMALIKRIPQRRLGTPRELEGALLLLCSDAGSYMTGATIAVDGGHLVSSL